MLVFKFLLDLKVESAKSYCNLFEVQAKALDLALLGNGHACRIKPDQKEKSGRCGANSAR